MKHRQQEGTEPNKGTVRDRKRRVQPTPGERSTDRNLGAPYQPQDRPPRIKREKHERGRYRERSAARREREKGQVLGTPIQQSARHGCRAPWSTSVRLCPRPTAARPGREESQGWEVKVMPWRRSLWIWNAAGRPCGKETKETKKRRRKDGDKVEDDDQGETNVRRELGVEGIV